jgi:putative transposase
MINILPYHPNYRVLPAQTAQQVIKFLVKSWKSYFRALKSFNKNPKKFNSIPRAPTYKRKAGFHILYFTSQQVNIKNGFIKFPKVMGLKIKTRLEVRINQARIIPRGNNFLLELIYEKEIPSLKPVKNIISIDIGLNNPAGSTVPYPVTWVVGTYQMILVLYVRLFELERKLELQK